MTDSTVVINGSFTKFALGLFASMILFLVGWSVSTTNEHAERINRLMEFRAVTEANRFTPADAILLQREMREYMDERIEEVEARVSSHHQRRIDQ